MKHRLFGDSVAAMREMCLEWYVKPLLAALTKREDGPAGAAFVIGPFRDEHGDAVGHRILPTRGKTDPGSGRLLWDEPDVQWVLAVDEIRDRLFADTGNELDDHGTFHAAFSAFCSEPESSSWSPEHARVFAVSLRSEGFRVVLEPLRPDPDLPKLSGPSLPPDADTEIFLEQLDAHRRLRSLMGVLEETYDGIRHPPKGSDQTRMLGALVERLREELHSG